MHFYRQNIIIFGIIVPGLGMLILCGLALMLKFKTFASFENKKLHHAKYERTLRSAFEIEKEIQSQRVHLLRWQNDLSQETASAVSKNLRAISSTLSPKEIQQTSFERPGGPGSFNSGAGQRSTQLRIAFRGTYRTMQRAFLGLETRMPQLQLLDLRIDPSQGHSALLNFQVTYTAWEN